MFPKIERFVELLLIFIRHNEPFEPFHFISKIAEIASSHSVKVLQEKPRDILKSSPIKQLWWITEMTLEKVAPGDRVSFLLDLTKNPKFISLSTYGLNFCLHQHGFFNEKDKIKEDERWVNDTELENIKKVWIDSVNINIQQNTFFDIGDTNHVLFMLCKLVDFGEIRDIVKSLIIKDEDLDNFARAIGRSGQDSIKGEFSHVPEDSLNAFGGADMIRERVKKRLQLSIKDMPLKAIYNSILTGEGYYLSDNTKKDHF